MASRKGVHFGDHQSRVSVRASHEALILPHPAREIGVLKQHGVGECAGEFRADFTFLVPRCSSHQLRTKECMQIAICVP
jgi:hypothetical protein